MSPAPPFSPVCKKRGVYAIRRGERERDGDLLKDPLWGFDTALCRSRVDGDDILAVVVIVGAAGGGGGAVPGDDDDDVALYSTTHCSFSLYNRHIVIRPTPSSSSFHLKADFLAFVVDVVADVVVAVVTTTAACRGVKATICV